MVQILSKQTENARNKHDILDTDHPVEGSGIVAWTSQNADTLTNKRLIKCKKNIYWKYILNIHKRLVYTTARYFQTLWMHLSSGNTSVFLARWDLSSWLWQQYLPTVQQTVLLPAGRHCWLCPEIALPFANTQLCCLVHDSQQLERARHKQYGVKHSHSTEEPPVLADVTSKLYYFLFFKAELKSMDSIRVQINEIRVASKKNFLATPAGILANFLVTHFRNWQIFSVESATATFHKI